MQALATLIGQYNLVALALADGQYGHVALDSSSRILQDHSTSSIKVGDGTDVLDILVEDAVAGGGEKGIAPFAVRQDVLASLVSASGDYSMLSVDANGALYVRGSGIFAEDSAHTTADLGQFILAVRNDVEGSMVSADGDYAPLQVDSLGRLRVNAELDPTPGTEQDEGADELGAQVVPGEIPSIGTAAWVDIVSMSVGAGETLRIMEVDGTADKLCQFQLIVDDDGTPTKWIRKFLVTENNGTMSLNFGRAIEVAGGATISVKLQAKRIRGGATDANAAGGINAWK